MSVAFSSLLVGRDDEKAAIGSCIEAAASGHGSTMILAGEAGIGKTRLAREAGWLAAGRGCIVLVGRTVEHESPTPFRPFQEALLSGLRDTGLPETDELAPFRAALGRLVPDWADAVPGADANPLVVGEAV